MRYIGIYNESKFDKIVDNLKKSTKKYLKRHKIKVGLPDIRL